MNPLAATLLLAYFVSVDSQCQQSCGPYSASWQTDRDGNQVKFTITFTPPTPANNYWTGIGFGKQMAGGDFVMITANATGGSISDRHGGGHSEPKADSHDDLKDAQVQIVGGKMVATFIRAIDTGDKNDVSLVDPTFDNCQCFMLPLTAGTVGPNGELEAHQKLPLRISVCNITQCANGANGGVVRLDNCKVEGSAPTQCDSAAPSAGSQEAVGAPRGVSSGKPEGIEGQNATGTQGQQGPTEGKVVASSPVPQGVTPASGGPINPASNQAGPVVTGNSGAERPPVLGGNAALNQGGADTVPQTTVSCQNPTDNAECQPYIDRYWLQIFKSTTPPLTHQYRKQACNNLVVHQKGQVRRECCNYLKLKCGDFMTNQDNLGSPNDNGVGSTVAGGQPQPTPTGTSRSDPNALENRGGTNVPPQTGPNGQPNRGGPDQSGPEGQRGNQAGPDGQRGQAGPEVQRGQNGPEVNQRGPGGPESRPGQTGPEGQRGGQSGADGQQTKPTQGGSDGRPNANGPDGQKGPEGQKGPADSRPGFPQNSRGAQGGDGPNGQTPPAGVVSGGSNGQPTPDRNGPNPNGQTGPQGGNVQGGPQGGQGGFGGQNQPQGAPQGNDAGPQPQHKPSQP